MIKSFNTSFQPLPPPGKYFIPYAFLFCDVVTSVCPEVMQNPVCALKICYVSTDCVKKSIVFEAKTKLNFTSGVRE